MATSKKMIRITDDIHKFLTERSEKEGRSMTQQLIKDLREYYGIRGK